MTGEEVARLTIRLERRKQWRQLRDDVGELRRVTAGGRLLAGAKVPREALAGQGAAWLRNTVERQIDSLDLAQVRLALSVLTNLVAPDPRRPGQRTGRFTPAGEFVPSPPRPAQLIVSGEIIDIYSSKPDPFRRDRPALADDVYTDGAWPAEVGGMSRSRVALTPGDDSWSPPVVATETPEEWARLLASAAAEVDAAEAAVAAERPSVTRASWVRQNRARQEFFRVEGLMPDELLDASFKEDPQ